jgi:hypothetical protein
MERLMRPEASHLDIRTKNQGAFPASIDGRSREPEHNAKACDRAGHPSDC